MFEQHDAEYSDKEQDFAEALVDTGILTITEDMNTAFDRISAHMKEVDEQGDLFDYQLQFWLDGEQVNEALIDSSVGPEAFERVRQQIIDFVKNSLH